MPSCTNVLDFKSFFAIFFLFKEFFLFSLFYSGPFNFVSINARTMGQVQPGAYFREECEKRRMNW